MKQKCAVTATISVDINHLFFPQSAFYEAAPLFQGFPALQSDCSVKLKNIETLSEVYLEPSQTSTAKSFCKNS